MVKNSDNNTRNTHKGDNKSVPQSGSNPASVMGEGETPHKVVSLRPGKGVRANLLEQEILPVAEGTREKLQTEQEARQLLAQAKDLWSKGETEAAEAEEVAAKAATMLSRARVEGAMTADHVSAALGDIFGFKAKADGTPSKTPNGQGEAIRKRIVRVAAASEFLKDGKAEDGFFKGVTPKTEATVKLKDGREIAVTVQSAYEMMFKGELGFWAAYEAFAAIKRATATPVPLAFNANRIAEIAATLQKDGAAHALVNNPALRKAYSQLWAICRVVGEEAAEIVAAQAA